MCDFLNRLLTFRHYPNPNPETWHSTVSVVPLPLSCFSWLSTVVDPDLQVRQVRPDGVGVCPVVSCLSPCWYTDIRSQSRVEDWSRSDQVSSFAVKEDKMSQESKIELFVKVRCIMGNFLYNFFRRSWVWFWGWNLSVWNLLVFSVNGFSQRSPTSLESKNHADEVKWEL